MTTRGQINSNFYQVVDVDADGNPTAIKDEFVANASVAHATTADTATSATTAATVTSAAQPNITSLGTLANLTSSGNITAPYFIGNVVGNISGNFVVPGSNTDVIFNNEGNAGASDNFQFDSSLNLLTVVGNITTVNADLGNLAEANFFSGSGNLLSNIQVGNVSGLGNIATINLDGSSSNVLYGNGAWAPVAGGSYSNANVANYLPTYSGVIANVTTNNLVANTATLSNTFTPITANVGQMFWDTGEHTVTLGMENGVQQQIGLESYIWVKANAAITDGQVVMFVGASGDNVLAAPANAAAVGFKPEYIVGIATQSIAHNSFGYVTVFGKVHGLNTNSYNVGDILWYDPTSTTGGLTNVQPTDPACQVQMAAVTKKAGGDGHIQVRVTALTSLTNLTDVKITTPSSGQALTYDSANLVWVNTDVSSGAPGGITTSVQFNNGGTFAGDEFFLYYTGGVDTGTKPQLDIGYPNVSLGSNAVYSGGVLRLLAQDPSVAEFSKGKLGGLVITDTAYSGDSHITLSANLVSLGSNANVKVTGGSTGQALITDGAGNLSWSNVVSSPAGSNTQIQFNDAGSFGGNANLTYDKTTKTFNVFGTSASILVGLGVGTDFVTLNASGSGNANIGGTLNAVGANLSANLTVANTANIANLHTTKYNETVVAGGSVSGTITPDVASGTVFNYTLTGNITLNSLANVVAGSGCTLILTQDGSGGRTLTSTMKFLGGAKTLSTAASSIDILSVFYDGSSYYASLGKGYS